MILFLLLLLFYFFGNFHVINPMSNFFLSSYLHAILFSSSGKEIHGSHFFLMDHYPLFQSIVFGHYIFSPKVVIGSLIETSHIRCTFYQKISIVTTDNMMNILSFGCGMLEVSTGHSIWKGCLWIIHLLTISLMGCL